jgi:hypothetical protein
MVKGTNKMVARGEEKEWEMQPDFGILKGPIRVP